MTYHQVRGYNTKGINMTTATQENKQIREIQNNLAVVRARKKEAILRLSQSGFHVPPRDVLVQLLHEAHHPHP